MGDGPSDCTEGGVEDSCVDLDWNLVYAYVAMEYAIVSRSKVSEVWKEVCYGCRTNHGSQSRHECVMEGELDYDAYFDKVMDKIDHCAVRKNVEGDFGCLYRPLVGHFFGNRERIFEEEGWKRRVLVCIESLNSCETRSKRIDRYEESEDIAADEEEVSECEEHSTGGAYDCRFCWDPNCVDGSRCLAPSDDDEGCKEEEESSAGVKEEDDVCGDPRCAIDGKCVVSDEDDEGEWDADDCGDVDCGECGGCAVRRENLQDDSSCDGESEDD